MTCLSKRPAQKGGIENVRTVRGRHHDDALRLREAVHLDEQLIERLLAFFVGQGRPAAIAANRIELVDEDDARFVATCITEQPSHACRTDAGMHLDEVEPLAEMNGTPASPAIDRASSVFPVPGGPTSRMPRGMRPPMVAKRAGSFRNSTISLTSSFASSTPATSAKVTGTVSGSIVLVRSSVGTRPVIMRTRTRPAIPNNRKPTATAPCRPALNDCWRSIEADAALGEPAHEGRIRGDVALRRHRLKRRSIATLEEQTLRRHGNGGDPPRVDVAEKIGECDRCRGSCAMVAGNQNGDRQQDNCAEDGACPEQAVSRNSSSEHAGLPYLVADEPTTAGKPGCNTARFLWERIIEDRATTCVQRF